MKTIYNTFKLFLLLVSGAFISCQDMNEVHEEYIKDGEIIYTNKVDSLSTFGGKNRVKIKGYITGAFNVNEIVVTWQDGEGQQIFPYNKSTQDTDSLALIVTELEENSYEFKVTSRDADGNLSVANIAFGTAYGERYRSNLEARTINHLSFDGSNMEVLMGLGTELQRGTEVKYTNTDNEEIITTVVREENNVLLENVSINSPIAYRTFYVPTAANEGIESTIDEFESDWETLVVPSFGNVLNSVVFNPVLGGLEMEWSNPDGAVLVYTITYTVNGVIKTQTINSSDVNGEAIVSGMDEGEQIINVSVADAYGNSFGPKDFTVTPIPAQLLDKSAWTIFDFSSEEAGGEGLVNGYATAAIDGDVNTFWHTQWGGASPPFPHHFSVDMGAEKTIASFETFRRQGNGNGQTKIKFLISTDGETWTDLGEFSVDSKTNDGQVSAIKSAPTARYFRYVAVEGPTNFAYLGEVNVYGLE
ncbi:hypothetical protein KCTC52924_00128 [Arenibacter antarcticus]|uniref:DUF4998 domain-containing protein n=1 Tax=Arenibacter antarcticus TaxID=2040469 RepID=A0ABW5VN96_9FLAO|nr:DUF4998 domain-containing protein [Arenibacter sp. H213]MCM4169106.1 hypothetical protein [Arenibacter sp. H213]